MVSYVPYWCEENVLRFLAGGVADSGAGVLDTRALFILPKNRSVAVFSQRAGRAGDGLVIWDYHAVALVGAPAVGCHGASWLVFDYDSNLDFGIGAERWLEASFGPLGSFGSAGAAYAPLFRILDGPAYVERSFSDRSHMKATDGSWMEPPPPWPASEAAGVRPDERWTLAELRDVGKKTGGGTCDLVGLRRFLDQGAC